MKIGLALGAGAARGLAHIGVLEVLQDNNIKIDYIAGTSIGSFVSAYYAVHLDISGLKQAIISLTRKDIWHLLDNAPKKYAIIKGEKIKDYIDKHLEGKSFSDTKIPLKVVATDLAAGREIVIRSGRLSEAVRASISVPGLFLPVEKGNMTLVDGGLLNSTPVDVVRKMGADFVIGVDLPLRKLKSKPNLFEALLQSYEIMREATVAKNKKTYIISPEFNSSFSGYHFLNKGYIELGRKAAEKAMPDILKMIGS